MEREQGKSIVGVLARYRGWQEIHQFSGKMPSIKAVGIHVGANQLRWARQDCMHPGSSVWTFTVPHRERRATKLLAARFTIWDYR